MQHRKCHMLGSGAAISAGDFRPGFHLAWNIFLEEMRPEKRC